MIYFAHSIEDYSSLFEKRCLNAITRKLNVSVKNVVNPAKYKSQKMSFYLRIVKKCNVLVWAKRQKDNKFTSGVVEEMKLAHKLGIKTINVKSLLDEMYYCAGIVRPRGYVFFEIDDKRHLFRFVSRMESLFNEYGIYETKHGYHLIVKCNEKWARIEFEYLKQEFESDYSWFKSTPPVLRISPKLEKNGKEVSPQPKLVFGVDLAKEIPKKYRCYYESEKR